MTYNLIESGQLNRSAAAEALRAFLEETIRVGKFDLKVSVRVLEAGAVPEQGGAEIFADLAGRDNELLLERGAELLQSIEHLAHRALRLEPPFQDKIFLDCAGYRALRVEEPKRLVRRHRPRVDRWECIVGRMDEDNLLRQVVYEGLREDKPAAEVRRSPPYPKP